MNFELKERFYKNMIIQRDNEDNERFKKAVIFQNNIFNTENDLIKEKEFFKLKQEIQNYKLRIDALQNENNYLKDKIRSCENKLKNFKYDIQVKNKRINNLMAENDIINKMYKDIYLSMYFRR
ncbi:hypothetical protein MKS88_003902 [Plasmodium brasilianum]|uniref:Uncharacterized protein n=2 Tax=Plasmodium (Plasmodium) TaxID=418103 RepID=A0A1A8X7A8_PLAMA|nr:conserved Plasmodium protein, unknown function [Plasmodium malariae]KAI4837428.1 hypothetical protein MKS88_003902 [Plasmodium brasilianum]SBT00493.1 conserved Plasmodium protein, unknown function [Plasmodium malariae]SCO93312.1 conserved Plasmodium protein, unknown function [Plasmodium malariae]